MEGWVGGWMGGMKEGRKGGKAGLRIAYSNQKFKFLITLKLNFNEGQFYKKHKILVISKNCKICSEIKF